MQCLWRPEEGNRTPGAGVIDVSSMDAGNQTWVPCKRPKCYSWTVSLAPLIIFFVYLLSIFDIPRYIFMIDRIITLNGFSMRLNPLSPFRGH